MNVFPSYTAVIGVGPFRSYLYSRIGIGCEDEVCVCLAMHAHNDIDRWHDNDGDRADEENDRRKLDGIDRLFLVNRPVKLPCNSDIALLVDIDACLDAVNANGRNREACFNTHSHVVSCIEVHRSYDVNRSGSGRASSASGEIEGNVNVTVKIEIVADIDRVSAFLGAGGFGWRSIGES